MKKCRHSTQGGGALIIVLALVVMMTMLAVSFFISATGEDKSSQSQARSSQAQQLASSAAQIVMAQIQAASTLTPVGSGNAVAWTSQPGLIRTFTVAAPASSASSVYKLYSATKMVNGSYTENEDAPPTTWKSSPALYCDINAPVSNATTPATLVYPVADGSIALSNSIPGFTVTNAPGYSGSSPSPTNNPLPMPVRWLYVLKDGQFTTPASVAADGTVTFTSTDPQPTTANPVVGRIAFWTDDETCKVNINTAGYAENSTNYWTFWDTPLTSTKDEFLKLSLNQPWANEFLRYPGHPATTGINIVFTNLTANQTADLTPRYVNGGSLGGSFTTPNFNQTNFVASWLTNIPTKTNRLYATVDELVYQTNRTTNAGIINSYDVDQRRFLLTATSRAPETTLFDTPRVTIWPEWQTTNSRTPIDKLIAFCSTIGSQPFYFVRSSSAATTELTSITDNANLYAYLQQITSRNLPGVGANFKTKYDNQKASEPNTCSRDQILTSFFDAIRLANLSDPATGAIRYASNGWVNSTYGPNGTYSPGRNPTIKEASVVFTRGMTTSNGLSQPSSVYFLQSNVIAFMNYTLHIPTVGPISAGVNLRMEVTGLTNFTVQTLSNNIVSGTNNNVSGTNYTTNTQQLFASNYTVQKLSTYINNEMGSDYGGMTFPTNRPWLPMTSLPLTNVSTNPVDTFIFNGGTLTIKLFSPTNATTPYQTCILNFPNKTNTAVPVPVIATNAGGVNPNSGYAWACCDSAYAGRFDQNYFDSRIIKSDNPGSSTGDDTVLSVSVASGDNRYAAIMNNLAGAYLVINTNYFTANRAATLYQGALNNATTLSNMYGSLVNPPARYDGAQIPVLPKQVNVERDYGGATAYRGGDWDSGFSYYRDGSSLPKVDEGISIYAINSGANIINYFYQWQGTRTVTGMFSPNRQVPSAVIFGNIPTGLWRSLLFRPDRSYHLGGTNHFGASSPHDLYLLDFFHMPVVEPYAISEPFSTAGKINMNAQVVPFSGYLTRDTALRAVLTSVQMTAISTNQVNTSAGTFSSLTAANAYTNQTRYPLNIGETLLGFQSRYTNASNPRVFLTAAEICNIDLVPMNSTLANLSSFWTTNRTTGDNARERPYAMLLPRLTAKSNTYTVHVTAQALAPGPGATGWQEGRGKVLSEWRGSYAVERYVDPNDSRLSGVNFLSGTQPVGPYYKFRVLGTRRFDP